MKKLMMFVMAAVFAAAFASGAYAAESAQLGLQVTFAVDQDLEKVASIKAHIEGIAAETRGQCQTFDADGDGEFTQADVFYWLKNGGDFNRDGKVDDMDRQILHEAITVLKGMAEEKLVSDIQALKDILARRPDLAEQIVPIINRGNELYASMRNYIDMLGKLNQPVISIELNQASWNLDGVKLGEKRDNFQNPYGKPIHVIKNAGNVSVFVDIGYGPTLIKDGMPPIIHPGLEQGLDTFITVCENGIIPPNARVPVVKLAEPGATVSLGLTYGAPTALSQNGGGMSATYELRAYPASISDPAPDPILNQG